MPKLKSSRGASKRFSLTARGKVKRQRAYHSHILTKKRKKRKRKLRQSAELSKADQKRIKRLMGW